jgi:hypothetical protein
MSVKRVGCCGSIAGAERGRLRPGAHRSERESGSFMTSIIKRSLTAPSAIKSDSSCAPAARHAAGREKRARATERFSETQETRMHDSRPLGEDMVAPGARAEAAACGAAGLRRLPRWRRDRGATPGPRARPSAWGFGRSRPPGCGCPRLRANRHASARAKWRAYGGAVTLWVWPCAACGSAPCRSSQPARAASDRKGGG